MAKRTQHRKVKNRTSSTKNGLWLVCLVVVFFMIGRGQYLKHYQDRDLELSFAFYYCANKVLEMETKQDGPGMKYYYETAQRIQAKIIDKKGIEGTREKMEKVYWANR